MNIGKGTKTTREQQTKRNYTMLTTEPKEKKKSKSQNKINKNEMRKNRTTTNNNISSKKRNRKGVNTEIGNDYIIKNLINYNFDLSGDLNETLSKQKSVVYLNKIMKSI